MRITINSDSSLSEAIGKLRTIYKERRYFQVTVNPGKRRSLDQNVISHAWYLQISQEEAEYSPGEVKNLCKYHLGLPIVRGRDEHFNAACVACIDCLPYESKIKAMEYMPVTSLMTTIELTQYLEAMQRHYAARVQLVFEGDK